MNCSDLFWFRFKSLKKKHQNALFFLATNFLCQFVKTSIYLVQSVLTIEKVIDCTYNKWTKHVSIGNCNRFIDFKLSARNDSSLYAHHRNHKLNINWLYGVCHLRMLCLCRHGSGLILCSETRTSHSSRTNIDIL